MWKITLYPSPEYIDACQQSRPRRDIPRHEESTGVEYNARHRYVYASLMGMIRQDSDPLTVNTCCRNLNIVHLWMH